MSTSQGEFHIMQGVSIHAGKSRRSAILALILVPALLLPATQVAAGPAEDLSVSFRGDDSRPPPGGIAGAITNSSARTYECVDLVFRLIYRGGSSGPTEQRVRVRNVGGRSVTEYSAPLQAQAGFGLDGIVSCAANIDPRPVPPPAPQHAARDCTVAGSVNSTNGFSGVDDTGQRHRIEKVYLLAPNGELVSEGTLWPKIRKVLDHRSNREYEARDFDFDFARLPEGQTYELTLSGAWRTEPERMMFTCPDERGRYDLRVRPFEHVGNRLGG